MSQHTIVLPPVCYICGKAADQDEHVAVVANYKSTRLNVPICNGCARRKQTAGRGLALVLSLLALAFLVSIGFVAELGRQARLAGANASAKAIALGVQVVSLLASAIILGSVLGIVRDGLRAFVLRVTGSVKTWEEAWTWVRYSRIGNDPVIGFPVFRNPDYARLVDSANK